MAKKINNQSDKSEKREPQDSEQKQIDHPQNDGETVVKPEDQKYLKVDAEFENPALERERGEQPVESVKKEPKE